MKTPERAAYGFDAPGVMRNALIGGTVLLFVGVFFTGHWGWVGAVLILAGVAVLLPGLCLLAYGLRGKFRVRDRMLSMVPWWGDETVLDVGTGRGLLLVGAAKRLTSGSVTGIDIWRAEDLSGNTRVNALGNAALEGVAGKVAVQDGDIRRAPFADCSFDVVLSLLCLHNIDDKQERVAACDEIARVLKPGGRVVIGDYIPTGRYAEAFAKAGLQVGPSRTHFADALGLMWIVQASKPPS